MRTLSEIYVEGKRVLGDRDLLSWCEAAAGTGATAEENERALRDVLVLFRALHASFEADISTTILGQESSAPFCPASVAGLSKVVENGEAQVVRASSDFGVPVFLWDNPSGGIEKCVQESRVPVFWVLKPIADLSEMETLIAKAEDSGVTAIGICVDVLYGLQSGDQHIDLKRIGAPVSDYYEKLRSMTRLPMFLKGILHPSDAQLAVDWGYEAIVVSNHGGRVLDYSCPTINVLPGIRQKIGDGAEIYVDSGFRTGLDVFRGLALGADAVLIGRPILYGLAVGGSQAVEEIYNNLAKELKRVMGLTDSRNVSGISSDAVTVREQLPLL